jgi:hypothetical protein
MWHAKNAAIAPENLGVKERDDPSFPEATTQRGHVRFSSR